MKNYNDYLNMIHKDNEQVIKEILESVMNEISDNNYSYEGICKLIANNVKGELQENNITSYVVDLNEYGVDHEALIAEYYHNELKRVLIDPSIVQFKIKLESFLNNKDVLLDLESNGYTFVDNNKFSKYISMFAGEDVKIDLDQFISEHQYRNK